VDYRAGVPRGGTWPGGRATLQGNYPRGVHVRKAVDDARYIYISYTLLAELHLFEQVKIQARSENRPIASAEHLGINEADSKQIRE